MKKILSLLLSLIILVSCLPLTVFAIDTEGSNNIARYSVLVLDVSGTASFQSNGVTIYTADSAIDYVKKSADSFLSNLIDAKGDNYVAVVTFAEKAKVISDFTNDIESVTEKVNSLSQNGTVRDINSGLSAADDLLQNIDDDVVKNVVLVTTGMTNAGEYFYDGHYGESTVASNWYRMDTQVRLYAYANAAYDTATSIKTNSTLYVLGLFQTMEKIPEKGKDVAEFFKLTASDLASSENTFYDVDDPSQLEFVFGEIADDITSSSGFFKYAGQINQNSDSVAEYWYSDSYFTKKSTVYNPSLATMSLCLELSSWSSYDKEKWYNPSYSQNDSGFWNDKLYNAKALLLGTPNGGEGYEGIGFSHFKANSYWQSAPTKDSIGVCAARKQITDKKGDVYTLVALVIRGGGYGAEWASNFTLGESGEHEGFAQARDNVINFLDEYVSDISGNESKNLKIWVTGFSRAGATANMVAGALDSYHILPNGVSVAMENIYCYTFEAPQGAVRSNLSEEDCDYSNIFNIINLNDLVPLVAPYSWDFSRYNYQNDKTLPSLYTTSTQKFNKQVTAMKKQLEQLGYSDFEYKVDEVSTMKNFKVDKSKFLPGGDPLWWWEDSSVDTHTVLENGINFIADDVIPSREYYYNYLEYCVRQLMGILMDYYGVKNGALNYAGEVAIKQFLSQFNYLFTFENLSYIISPMVSPNPFYSYQNRIKDVKLRLGEKVGGIFGEFSKIEGFIDSIVEILTDVIVQVAEDVWNNNTDSINTVCKLVDTITTSEFQGHYPEICLAWCRSLDPNYTADVEQNTSSATRVIRINCPVDVKVYDNEGNLVGAIVNGVSDETVEGVVNLVNNNGEKLFYLPGDESYTIEIVATGEGTLNYSLSEYNFVRLENSRLQNYYDIPIQTGDNLTAIVPAISDEELKDNNLNGSTVSYQLYYYDSLLSLDDEFAGEQIKQEYYNVILETEGNSGYVDGSGEFIKGSFAQLEAYTLPNGEFLGWYDGEELLSTDSQYRFAVKEDVTITAKFSNIEFYGLNIETNGGGTVNFEDNYLPGDIEISLEAIPNDGYVFEKWISSNGGAFMDSTSSTTTYITGIEDTTVTAIFREEDNNEPVSDLSSDIQESSHSETEPSSSNSSKTDISSVATGVQTNTVAIVLMFLCVCVAMIIIFKKKRA